MIKMARKRKASKRKRRSVGARKAKPVTANQFFLRSLARQMTRPGGSGASDPCANC